MASYSGRKLRGSFNTGREDSQRKAHQFVNRITVKKRATTLRPVTFKSNGKSHEQSVLAMPLERSVVEILNENADTSGKHLAKNKPCDGNNENCHTSKLVTAEQQNKKNVSGISSDNGIRINENEGNSTKTSRLEFGNVSKSSEVQQELVVGSHVLTTSGVDVSQLHEDENSTTCKSNNRTTKSQKKIIEKKVLQEKQIIAASANIPLHIVSEVKHSRELSGLVKSVFNNSVTATSASKFNGESHSSLNEERSSSHYTRSARIRNRSAASKCSDEQILSKTSNCKRSNRSNNTAVSNQMDGSMQVSLLSSDPKRSSQVKRRVLSTNMEAADVNSRVEHLVSVQNSPISQQVSNNLDLNNSKQSADHVNKLTFNSQESDLQLTINSNEDKERSIGVLNSSTNLSIPATKKQKLSKASTVVNHNSITRESIAQATAADSLVPTHPHSVGTKAVANKASSSTASSVQRRSNTSASNKVMRKPLVSPNDASPIIRTKNRAKVTSTRSKTKAIIQKSPNYTVYVESASNPVTSLTVAPHTVTADINNKKRPKTSRNTEEERVRKPKRRKLSTNTLVISFLTDVLKDSLKEALETMKIPEMGRKEIQERTLKMFEKKLCSKKDFTGLEKMLSQIQSRKLVLQNQLLKEQEELSVIDHELTATEILLKKKSQLNNIGNYLFDLHAAFN